MLAILFSGRWASFTDQLKRFYDAFTSQLKKPQLIRPMDTLMSRALPKGSDLSDNATKIEVSDDVLDAFPNHLPDKNLHIIVIKPPGG
jgi:hypothetical protein